MAPVPAAKVLTTRRSSRIQQQMNPSSEVIISTTLRSSRIWQRTISSSKGTVSKKTSSATKRQSSKRKQQTSSSSGATASTTTVGGILLKLPPEIRNMIYAVLLSTGEVSILRTCREINMEAQSMLYRAGICRKKAGYCPVNKNFDSTSSGFLNQNFELRCNIDSRFEWPPMFSQKRKPSRQYHQFWPASPFGRGDIRRNQMLIELRFDIKDSVSEIENTITCLLDRAKSFVGFRVLVVKFLPTPRRYTIADETRIRLVVKNILEPDLGPAVDYEEKWDDGRCIEFRPWSNAGRQSHKLEPVCFITQAFHRVEEAGETDEMDDY